jgi:anaerobic selenocysteine-containing dehydrogenase
MALVGPGTELADDVLQLRINSDIAVLKGLMKTVLEEDARTGEAGEVSEVIDRTFLEPSYCFFISKSTAAAS